MTLRSFRSWSLLLLAGLAYFQAVPLRAARAEQVRFLGLEFVAYWVDLETDQLSLCWRDEKGEPLGTFGRLQEYVAARSGPLRFAINAGIYARDGSPLGLHIEEGQVFRPLNVGALEGGQWNFYLKPNGVFSVVGNTAAILETGQFAQRGVRPRLACQSGPLLLSAGAIHPAFQTNSTNFHWRSGVGVAGSNQVVFALSKQPLRFYDFARLFRDRLGCQDALYLDGDICAIYLPELGYTAEKPPTRLAGMFAVTAQKPRP